MGNKTRPSILAIIHGYHPRPSISAIIPGYLPRPSFSAIYPGYHPRPPSISAINLGYHPRPSISAINPGHQSRLSIWAINPGYHPRPSISAINPGYHPRPSSSLPSTAAVIHGHRRHYRCNSQHNYRHVDRKRLACRSCFCVLMVLSSHTCRDNAAMGRFLRDTATVLTCCGPGALR